MLEELAVKNYALIDEAKINFSSHFNVITGETGTGKSIIIGALNLVLGERTQPDQIREGRDFALVSGIFSVPDDDPNKKMFEDMGIPIEENKIILSRQISRSGKSVCRINGSPVTLAQLKSVGDRLVDVCGQHDHISLLNPQNHLHILDSMALKEQPYSSYKKAFTEYNEKCMELEALVKRRTELKQKLDFYEFQLKELTRADLKSLEEESLREKAAFLENKERLFSMCSMALGKILEGENPVLTEICKAMRAVEQAGKIDNSLKEIYELMTQCQLNLQEAADSLQKYTQSLSQPQDDLNEINARLMEIGRLKKKYNMDVKAILDYRNRIESEIKTAENFDFLHEEMLKQREELLKILEHSAQALTCLRTKTARKLDKEINILIKNLGMPRAVFKTQITPFEEFKSFGRDNVEFVIQANPGEPLKPLSRIASGGEISRLILAIKSILAGKDRISTLVFDEVDSGIGGKIANQVAEVLRELSVKQQIVCITHLHQIASRADFHLAVEKTSSKGRTISLIRILDKLERVKELARMLGDDQSKKTLEHAKELMKE